MLEPGARRMSGEGFTGWLRGPADPPGTVVVVPGLDSAKEEFLDLVDALLARGPAVFAMDGPGQGVLAATTTFVPGYERVVGRVIDALGVARIGPVPDPPRAHRSQLPGRRRSPGSGTRPFRRHHGRVSGAVRVLRLEGPDLLGPALTASRPARPRPTGTVSPQQ